MDPFNALSIAAAVVQFVEYATGILKDYREIRQAGQPLTFDAFEQTTKDLLKLNATLMNRSQISGISRNRLTEDEKVRLHTSSLLSTLTFHTNIGLRHLIQYWLNAARLRNNLQIP